MRRTSRWCAAVMAGLMFTGMTAGQAAAGPGTPESRTYGWGLNSAGQVGIGTWGDSYDTAQPVLPGTEFVQASAGEGHTLAITEDGTLYSWGTNTCGQLGTGNLTARTTPGVVPGLTGVTAFAAGRNFSVAATRSGVYAWGCNDKGQLGIGTTGGPVSTPVPIEGVHRDSDWVVTVAAGYDHALAATLSGRLYGWGLNDDGEIGDGTTQQRTSPVPVTLGNDKKPHSVSAGVNHTVVTTEDRLLFAWGANSDGQLGLGEFGPDRLTPTRVPTPAGSWAVGFAGGHHTLFTLQQWNPARSTVYSVGQNGYGQLGTGDKTDRATPYPVATRTTDSGFYGFRVVAGLDFSLVYAIDPKAKASTFGNNRSGQLGLDSTAPEVLSYSPASVAVTSGSCAVEGSHYWSGPTARHTLGVLVDGLSCP